MQMIWFIVPVHGRLQLAQICLRQLRHTCNTLTEAGIAASAVVISDSSTLSQLEPQTLGFATVERDNQFLGRKFNDGIQLATDPKYNPHPADYVVPCGSDDWVDYRLFLEPLPDDRTIQGFQWMSFVNETGSEIRTVNLGYEGGSGIRIIPRALLEPQRISYRPAEEDQTRGCDTSILVGLKQEWGPELKVKHFHLHERQIVDWKTDGEQLNSYQTITVRHPTGEPADPFRVLDGFYPRESLDEMFELYRSRRA